jgi:hypothetical protein
LSQLTWLGLQGLDIVQALSVWKEFSAISYNLGQKTKSQFFSEFSNVNSGDGINQKM